MLNEDEQPGSVKLKIVVIEPQDGPGLPSIAPDLGEIESEDESAPTGVQIRISIPGEPADLRWRDMDHQTRGPLWDMIFGMATRVLPIVTPWSETSLGVQRASDTAERLETAFLLRVLRQYRLAVVILGYERSGEGDDDAARCRKIRRNQTRLKRAFKDWRAPDVSAIGLLGTDISETLKVLFSFSNTLSKYQKRGEENSRSILRKFKNSKSPFTFLYYLSRYDRLGRWSTAKSRQDIFGSAEWEQHLIPETNSLLDKHLLRGLRIGDDKNGVAAQETSALLASNEYRLIRDCARWVREGGSPWLRNWAAKADEDGLKFLFIDSELSLKAVTRHPFEYQQLLHLLFQSIARVIEPKTIEVHVLDSRDGIYLETAQDGAAAHWRQDLSGRIKRKLDFNSPKFSMTDIAGGLPLEDYNAIFCEVDLADPWGGPHMIHTIVSHVERVLADPAVVRRRGQRAAPAIIVLTRSNRFEQAHECLNMGAHAFVTKDRLLQIVVRLKVAVLDLQRRQAAIDGQGNDHTSISVEHLGHRTNFRILDGLGLERKAGLKDTRAASRIIGDAVDREWIRGLPKADLHVHLGTSISLPVIEALAWNSVGNLLDRAGGAFHYLGSRSTAGPHAGDAAADALTTVWGAGLLQFAQHRRGCEGARDAIHQAACLVSGRDYRTSEQPMKLALDFLNRPENAVPAFQVTALMVAALSLFRALQESTGANWTERADGLADRVTDAIVGEWDLFGRVAEWMGTSPHTDVAIQANRHMGRLNLSVHRTPLQPQGPAAVPVDWAVMHDRVRTRVRLVVKAMTDLLEEIHLYPKKHFDRFAGAVSQDTLQNLNVLRAVPVLDDLAYNPVLTDGSRFGLPSYLDAGELLGAEHLQFPENIALAALDLVRQNVEDTIVYAEVRCETPGYTKAGMGAAGATRLLQAAFDAGALFFSDKAGNSAPGPLVRVNILLAAKRHKTSEECARVVALLESYLEHNGPAARAAFGSAIPKWWGPSQIVGFDLSGNEGQDREDIGKEIGRLFRLNSPISIHAGEATSAESVWRAVYLYHARRIGHGLRLRENRTLLQYCVDEGICMELCPSSNASTHGFPTIERIEDYFAVGTRAYPLRHYMEAGLEVCINTDNRALHRRFGDDTPDARDRRPLALTDEYLRAATLSGGLTRWEVLKLVRSSLKHAFLHRNEVGHLLSASESQIITVV